MSFFTDWATGRALRDAALFAVRYAMPIIGAMLLIAAVAHITSA